MLVAHFGWAKPVEIDSRNFNSKYSIAKAEAIVSLAGPIMNFIMAFVFTILLYILFPVTNAFQGLSESAQLILRLIIEMTIIINIGLGIFNLIPLPPLDGSKVLTYFLPYNIKQWFYNNTQIFFIIFIVLLISGYAGRIIMPLINSVAYGMDWITFNLINLFM